MFKKLLGLIVLIFDLILLILGLIIWILIMILPYCLSFKIVEYIEDRN